MIDLTTVDIRLAVGNPAGNYPIKIRCKEPTHRDTEHSMVVYQGYIRCFGCGKVIQRRMEALAYLLYGNEQRWRDAIKVAGKYAARPDTYRENVSIDENPYPLPGGYADIYHDFLLTGGKQYRLVWLHERGLTLETIRQFKIGHDVLRFTIPVYNSTDDLLTIRFRRDDLYDWDEEEYADQRLPKYSGMPGRNGRYLYPEWLIAKEKPSELYVWEGEFDTMLSWQLGYPAMTVTNGAGNLTKLPQMLHEQFPFVTSLVIGGDMDAAGREARIQTGRAAEGLFHIRPIEWDIAQGKDLTEYVLHGGTLGRRSLIAA